jgi:hypothetical protein|tara:strand:- start:95 stop:340 length:246 start_codon:yes stop_codon:yes gene_type:complete
MNYPYQPHIRWHNFLATWKALFDKAPQDRLEALKAMSRRELNYFIAPSLRDMMTRDEKIEEHMIHFARENGEIEEEDDMDF